MVMGLICNLPLNLVKYEGQERSNSGLMVFSPGGPKLGLSGLLRCTENGVCSDRRGVRFASKSGSSSPTSRLFPI